MKVKNFFGLLLMLCNVFVGTAQNTLWKKVESVNERESLLMERRYFPKEAQLFSVNYDAIKQKLATAPDEFSSNAPAVFIQLPNASKNSGKIKYMMIMK